jgi:subtilisin family serine protease
VVEGGGLENRWRASVRGFESLPLRQCRWLAAAVLVASVAFGLVASVARADEPSARIEARLARALADPAVARMEHSRQRLEAARRLTPDGDELAVIVEPPEGRGADALPLAELQALGARIDGRSRGRVRITGSPAVLARVAELGGVRELRFPRIPVPVEGSGAIVSEAVGLIGASALQAAGIDGSGVAVGIVDVGFLRIGDAKAAGEVAASAIEVDLSGNGMESGTSHGTAVAEQVTDVAPGAQLYLILIADDLDFENAIDYLATHGIRIANLSVNWFAASYYDDTGPISGLLNASYDQGGVFWAVGAGNWAFRHWRGLWLDEDGDSWLSFSPNDERLGLLSERPWACVTLNWNQYNPFGPPPTDLDLFVYSASGAQVASSEMRQTLGALPIEEACFEDVVADRPHTLGVHRFAGPTGGLDLTITSADTAIAVAERVPASSMVDPAVAHGAFAVGAIAQFDWLGLPPPLEAFSSQGPTNDGRTKPDLVAPDRAATFSYGAAPQGTSFASPVVAGAAALFAQQSPGLSAKQIRAALANAANDVGPIGVDNQYGRGQLVAEVLPLPVDSDGDGVPDATDKCRFAPDPGQADTNGDGIGNACTCGDVDATGTVTASDEAAIRGFLANPATALARPSLCNVFGVAAPFPIDCRINDWVVMRRARAGRSPGNQQVCRPALPP